MSIANEMNVGSGPTSGTGSEGGRDLKQTAQQVKDAVVEKVGEVRDRASHALEAGRDKAQAYYEQGKDAASDYMHQGVDKAKQFEHSVEQYIREKPIQSVLIAAGIGVVLGALLKR